MLSNAFADFIGRWPIDRPDFAGHFGRGVMAFVEVRVREQEIELSWPNTHGLALTLSLPHTASQPFDGPIILDVDFVWWLRNSLRLHEKSTQQHAVEQIRQV